MPNRLAPEISPYLLDHADNPVDWFPWGDEAFTKAKTENKPIFLSIGYSACHWCHVMAHESFESHDIARLLNHYFVSIKVDREERPDIDHIYMKAVVMMTGHGGWPMSVFITPDGHPFFAGTYFPTSPKYGLPGFGDLLENIHQAWMTSNAELESFAKDLTSRLQEYTDSNNGEIRSLLNQLPEINDVLRRTHDRQFGGWGSAPKFPQPMLLDYLLRQATRGDKSSLEVALIDLNRMMRGGIHDWVAGGFHRYSTDKSWLVPHFEKMLYDNAQIALVYLHAYQLTGDGGFLEVCERTLRFCLSELRHQKGGFYSSLDADTGGIEGATYTWDYLELMALLESHIDREIVSNYFSLSPTGNFEGKIILHNPHSHDPSKIYFDLYHSNDNFHHQRLTAFRQTLQARRSQREQPDVDHKVIASWNGFMLVALSEAARALRNPDYQHYAQELATFLIEDMYSSSVLYRIWKEDQCKQPGFLEDYASVILGLLSMYQTDNDPKWYQSAKEMTEDMLSIFYNGDQGFFDVPVASTELIINPKDCQDNAIPSGSSMACKALIQMYHWSLDHRYQEIVEKLLLEISENAVKYPSAHAYWLQCVDDYKGPFIDVITIGDKRHDEVLSIIWKEFRPRLQSAMSADPASPMLPRVFDGKSLAPGKISVYLCEGFTCSAMVNNLDHLATNLDSYYDYPTN